MEERATDELLKEIGRLKEQVRSQQEMLESTTKFLIGTQETLEEKRAELERKNHEIFEGISYASVLQSGIFPYEQRFKEYFSDAFVRLKQRDIIGGDMPFLHDEGDTVVVAAIDCTGHGVSGAMLTMLAQTLLLQILNSGGRQRKPRALDQVLKLLNRYFMGAFNDDRENYFGMDIAILRMHKQTGEAQFAGAGRPMLLMRNGELIRYQKTGLGIGVDRNLEFTSRDIQLQKNDKLYLYSDGVTDQLGGNTSKKFSDRKLRGVISEIGYLNMRKQNEVIFDFLTSWQGREEQTDNQLLLGIQI